MKHISFLCIVLFTAFITLFISCTKHRGDIEEPPAAATIVFASPTQNSIYHYGDSISVQAKAIALKTVHGYDVRIKKANDTTTYFFRHVHEHNDSLSINQKWKNELTGNRNLEAEITLYLDHEGNTAIKKVGFKIQ